jgi:hypothetical protein
LLELPRPADRQLVYRRNRRRGGAEEIDDARIPDGRSRSRNGERGGVREPGPVNTPYIAHLPT